jgi:hypothetical protein
MSWISKIFNGGKVRLSEGSETEVLGQSVRNAAFDQTEDEQAYRNNMAIISEAIRDEGMERILAEKMFEVSRVYVKDDLGNFVYAVDKDGNLMIDSYGCKIHVVEERTKVNDFYAAIYNFQSQVNRLSHINAADAKISYWELENIISNFIMSMPRSQLNSGELAYIKSWLNHVHILLQDATGGKKLNSLLTIHKTSSQNVVVGTQEKKKVF